MKDRVALPPPSSLTANWRTSLWIVALSAFVLAASGSARAQTNSSTSPAQMPPACATHGGWVDARSGRSIFRENLFRYLASKRSIVLLGEAHTDVVHHSWQLHTVAALHGRGANLML